jgi:hypothetical protein
VNAMNAYGKVEVSSTNSFLGHRWRWVVNIMPPAALPSGKELS